jgi:hypothetical protein
MMDAFADAFDDEPANAPPIITEESIEMNKHENDAEVNATPDFNDASADQSKQEDPPAASAIVAEPSQEEELENEVEQIIPAPDLGIDSMMNAVANAFNDEPKADTEIGVAPLMTRDVGDTFADESNQEELTNAPPILPEPLDQDGLEPESAEIIPHPDITGAFGEEQTEEPVDAPANTAEASDEEMADGEAAPDLEADSMMNDLADIFHDKPAGLEYNAQAMAASDLSGSFAGESKEEEPAIVPEPSEEPSETIPATDLGAEWVGNGIADAFDDAQMENEAELIPATDLANIADTQGSCLKEEEPAAVEGSHLDFESSEGEGAALPDAKSTHSKQEEEEQQHGDIENGPPEEEKLATTDESKSDAGISASEDPEETSHAIRLESILEAATDAFTEEPQAVETPDVVPPGENVAGGSEIGPMSESGPDDVYVGVPGEPSPEEIIEGESIANANVVLPGVVRGLLNEDLPAESNHQNSEPVGDDDDIDINIALDDERKSERMAESETELAPSAAPTTTPESEPNHHHHSNPNLNLNMNLKHHQKLNPNLKHHQKLNLNHHHIIAVPDQMKIIFEIDVFLPNYRVIAHQARGAFENTFPWLEITNGSSTSVTIRAAKASLAKIALKSSRIDLPEEVFAVWDQLVQIRNAMRRAIPVR